VKSGILFNGLTLDQNDYQILWYKPPYITTYRHSPWELGLYLQDKIEYDFLILNLGLRYDSSYAGEIPYWTDPRNPTDPNNPSDVIENPFDPTTAPVKAGEVRGQVSPRFGISHPVTDQSVIYFNYGHFYQNPIYRNLYIEGTLLDAVPLIGNPNMTNEKTASYEFGFRQQFTDVYSMELTLWSKDTSNMVGSETVPAFSGGVSNPYEYTVFLNYDYAQSKGVDVSLVKRYSNFFSGQVNYSYMHTVSNRDDPWSGYRNGDTLEQSPKRPRVLGWDQPHRVSAQVSVQVPEGVGPMVAGIRPLQKISASLVFRANAGRPYTPTTKDITLDPNSGRRPWTYQWDMRVYRDFETFGIRYSVFAFVQNVFDRKNILSVYSRTGKADDPGPDATQESDDYDRSYYYGSPRLINVGLRIFF
jgi:outer membrane receptor protein involved in Fe transport